MPNVQITLNQKTRLEARAKVLKALSHPTRLYLVETLADQSHNVNALTDMVGADVSTISKHLSILKDAGLISGEKKGKQVFYRLRMRCALNFLDCVEAVLKEKAKDHLAVIR